MRFAAALLALSLPALGDPRAELGRRLFMDPTVSRTGRVSCSSCHQPEHGFSDPRARSEDEIGSTRRRSQPLLDLEDVQPLHWDGEFASVREVIDARLAPAWRLNAIAGVARIRRFEDARAAGMSPDGEGFRRSLGLQPYGGLVRSDHVPVARRLGDDHRYDAGFRAAFGTPEITQDRIADALEAYVLSLRSGTSAFDRGALTEAQVRGLVLFKGKANCAACHLAEGRRPRFTDGAFHDTGIAQARGHGCSLGDCLDVGVGAISSVRADLYAFKTPSLRDVARRPPYMHSGSLATLADVVRYYNGGGFGGRKLDPRIRPLALSDDEVSDLVAFLEALTSDERPGVGPARRKPHRTELRIVDLHGKPLAGLPVEVQPAGDRLGRAVPRHILGLGRPPVERPGTLVTDEDGRISFDFPAWTHVRVVAPELDFGRLIPDCVGSMELIAAPTKSVALKLRMPPECCPETLLDVRVTSGCGLPPHTVASLRLIRTLADGRALYVTDPVRSRRWAAGGRVVGELRAGGPDRSWTLASRCEIDVSGGWAEPLDLGDVPPGGVLEPSRSLTETCNNPVARAFPSWGAKAPKEVQTKCEAYGAASRRRS